LIAPDEIRTEGTAPERRRVVRLVAGINVAFLVVDVALHGATLPVIGGRLLVSAALLAVDLALGCRLSAATLRRALCGLALLLVAGFGVLALGTGGAESPYLGFLAFLAIVLGIAVPDEPAVNVTAGLGGAAVAFAIALAARQPAATLGFIAVGYGSCTFYGAVSAGLYRRMRRRERAAWAAQAEAAAALARSELRRAAVERAAAVGRIAGELGHELSSPVASVAANLRFLEQELPPAEGDGELRAAVRESREALDRVARVVGDLRVLTPDDAWAGGEVDLRLALERGLELAAMRQGGPAAVAPALPKGLTKVQASSHQLSQVVSILVGLFTQPGKRAVDRVAVDVALEAGAVKVAFTGKASGRADPAPGPERAGVGIALCRELAEPWGGRVEARPVAGGRVELALTLRWAGGLQPAPPPLSS